MFGKYKKLEKMLRAVMNYFDLLYVEGEYGNRCVNEEAGEMPYEFMAALKEMVKIHRDNKEKSKK